ncbi:NADPH-dependent F420 reductase [Streptomyces mirabilis]|uniref:NADPH-dependent F420 reductase n=1 Tax=Streptomyces mirabilis TaxID=68239 RepID=UPI003664D5FE
MSTYGTIGVLGAGEVGQAVADKAVRRGHDVLIGNSRGPGTLETLVGTLGPRARAVTAEEAAKPELVFLSVPFFAVPEPTGLTTWAGKVVVDTTNQFAAANPWQGRYDVGDLTGSDWVARHLPGARIVKALNTLYAPFIAAAPGMPKDDKWPSTRATTPTRRRPWPACWTHSDSPPWTLAVCGRAGA